MTSRLVASLLMILPAATGCRNYLTQSEGSEKPAEEEAALAKGGRAATEGVIFVSSQNLYYDTFVTRDPLPMEGKFQLLENNVTEFGPGDPEYLGGRWWEDTNGNGIQDATDHYFLCPLLPPGRPSP